MAFSETRLSGLDWLIQTVLTATPGILSAALCDLADNPTQQQVDEYNNCRLFYSALAFGGSIFGTRTVRYRCNVRVQTAMEPAPAGSEGATCGGEQSCDAGLTCVSEVCVKLPGLDIEEHAQRLGSR